MANRTYYAWQEGDKYFMSFFPPVAGEPVRNKVRPVAWFETKEELEAEINRRNVSVKWENG